MNSESDLIFDNNVQQDMLKEYSPRLQQMDDEKNALEVSNLTKTYSDGKIRAVDGISFFVRTGEIFGLLGPNGAGKTTTIKMIVTLTKATSGRLEVFGVDVSKSPEMVRSMLGYVPQSISVDADLTAYENLLIFSKLSYVNKKEREDRIHSALKQMDLEKRANEIVKHFSGGMMRRLEIAQALVNRPRLLLLDEHSIGLDPASKRQVWKNVKQLRQDYGTTIMITTHDMAEADALCDRLAIMSAGKIAVLGNPAELKKTVIGGDIVTVTLASDISHKDIKFPASMRGTILTAASTTRIEGIDNDDSDNNKNNDAKVGDGKTSIQILVDDGGEAIPHITDAFRECGIKIESISVGKPTLDDVFMKYAKRRLIADENGVGTGEDLVYTSSSSSSFPNSSSKTRRDFVGHAK
jgi:ABC-2 type transport system ATP-binding protein